MAPPSNSPRFSKPHFNRRPQASPVQGGGAQSLRINGSAQQKQTQWLVRATEAERAGDAVEAEMCRQYAEHWFRVSRGQE
ncbi:DUF4167 domain-containing protein [Azospirillum sp. SYSU D00513]|uniref:DUF4167 domain-containing protein n=1 Tax=Azospirillum sp. SYSU D00513 TaxID=2812561 RepID=UPI001A96A303|nr:DUF4167 domain-containing protein [Azospirillum sp. SYSU D00513]